MAKIIGVPTFEQRLQRMYAAQQRAIRARAAGVSFRGVGAEAAAAEAPKLVPKVPFNQAVIGQRPRFGVPANTALVSKMLKEAREKRAVAQATEAGAVLEAQAAATSGIPKWFPYAVGVSALAIFGVLFLRRKAKTPAPPLPPPAPTLPVTAP